MPASTNIQIRVLEPSSGSSFVLSVPSGTCVSDLRRLVADGVADLVKTCELYQERTGRLLPKNDSTRTAELCDGDVLRVLPPRELAGPFGNDFGQ